MNISDSGSDARSSRVSIPPGSADGSGSVPVRLAAPANLDHVASDPPPEDAIAPEPGSASAAADRRFPCGQCGARLEFSPADAALKCPWCGHVTEIPQTAEAVVELDFEAWSREKVHEETVVGLDREIACATCGGRVLFSGTTETDNCPYCGTNLTNEPAPADRMIPPNAVLPFAIDQPRARTAFNAWVRGRWFVPNDFRRLALAGKLHGMYLPHWTFDAMTVSHYTGQRGDHYWVTETYTTTDANGNQRQQTRQVQHTRWSHAAGRVDHAFDDLLILASGRLPEKWINELAPWDLQELRTFDPAFLPGFQTERYTMPLAQGFEQAKGVMHGVIVGLCRADIGGDAQRVDSVRTQHLGVSFKHLLLPVWHAVYRYRDRPFHIFVNARTGEVQGERPVSWWKVAGVVAGVIAAVLGVVALASR